MMRCVESIKDLHDIVSQKNDIAFVPTMGNLHAGHIKLIERAKSLSDNVVVSIFINRTQFNSKKDYDTYPKTCLLYTSPSPRDVEESRMPSSA